VKQQQRPEFPMTSEGAEGQIASRLRAFYLSVQEEPIPQKFLDLLEKLDLAEQREMGIVEQRQEMQLGSDDR
jgi:hypothetical protein